MNCSFSFFGIPLLKTLILIISGQTWWRDIFLLHRMKQWYIYFWLFSSILFWSLFSNVILLQWGASNSWCCYYQIFFGYSCILVWGILQWSYWLERVVKLGTLSEYVSSCGPLLKFLEHWSISSWWIHTTHNTSIKPTSTHFQNVHLKLSHVF